MTETVDGFSARQAIVADLERTLALLHLAETDGAEVLRKQARLDMDTALAGLVNPETKEPEMIGRYRAFYGFANDLLSKLDVDRLTAHKDAAIEELRAFDEGIAL